MKKILLPAALAVLVLAGILLSDALRYDAAEFLTDALEHSCTGKGSGRYLRAVGADGDELYAVGVQAEADFLADYLDLAPEKTADGVERVTELCEKLLSRAKFKAGRAVRTDDGWDVEVTVYPLDAVRRFMAEDDPALTADWSARYDNQEFDAMPEAEYETLWLDTVLEKLEPRVKKAGYLEPQTVTAAIRQDADGRYALTADSAAALDALIIAY